MLISRYGQFQAAIGALITFVYDPLIASQVPVTGYGSLMLNHVGDGSFYGDASDRNAMAARIVTNIKKQTRPAFLLAAYQRFRQDDFANRTSPGSSDISIPRLNQVVQLVKADPVVGQYVQVVTPQTFSALLRKKLGLAGADEVEDIPGQFALMQNYPNPFNPTTGIRYQVPGVSDVNLVVYDVLGQEVAVLVNERKPPGAYETMRCSDL